MPSFQCPCQPIALTSKRPLHTDDEMRVQPESPNSSCMLPAAHLIFQAPQRWR